MHAGARCGVHGVRAALLADLRILLLGMLPPREVRAGCRSLCAEEDLDPSASLPRGLVPLHLPSARGHHVVPSKRCAQLHQLVWFEFERRF